MGTLQEYGESFLIEDNILEKAVKRAVSFVEIYRWNFSKPGDNTRDHGIHRGQRKDTTRLRLYVIKPAEN